MNSKEEFLSFVKRYEQLVAKSEKLWRIGYQCEGKEYEYFTSVDYVSFDGTSTYETVFVSGYDGSSTVGATIPIKYFYLENGEEQLKNDLIEEKRLRDEKRNKELEYCEKERLEYRKKLYEELKREFDN